MLGAATAEAFAAGGEVGALSGGGEAASEELLAAVQSHGRTITIATEGSEELAYLEAMGAEANVGGPALTHILLREGPSKAAVLEEFLHGTQFRLGIVERLGVEGAESQMAGFLARHARLLGLE